MAALMGDSLQVFASLNQILVLGVIARPEFVVKVDAFASFPASFIPVLGALALFRGTFVLFPGMLTLFTAAGERGGICRVCTDSHRTLPRCPLSGPDIVSCAARFITFAIVALLFLVTQVASVNTCAGSVNGCSDCINGCTGSSSACTDSVKAPADCSVDLRLL